MLIGRRWCLSTNLSGDLMLPSGSPYMNANINLPPGQSITLQPQFTNPGNVPIAYSARVLAGAGSR